MRLIISGLLLQYAFGSVGPVFWFVPDFMVLAMVLAIARCPGRWPVYVSVVSAFLMFWALRNPALIAIAWLAAGAATAWVASQWNLHGLRPLIAVCAGNCIFIYGLLIWSENLWSWPIVLFLSGRVALTLLSLFAFHPFWKRAAASL